MTNTATDIVTEPLVDSAACLTLHTTRATQNHATVLFSSSPMLVCNLSCLVPTEQLVAMPPCFDLSPVNNYNSTLSHAADSLVHWISITPGLPSFGFHLLDKHHSLFACHQLVLTASIEEANLCRAILPDSLVVTANFHDVVRRLTLPSPQPTNPNPSFPTPTTPLPPQPHLSEPLAHLMGPMLPVHFCISPPS